MECSRYPLSPLQTERQVKFGSPQHISGGSHQNIVATFSEKNWSKWECSLSSVKSVYGSPVIPDSQNQDQMSTVILSANHIYVQICASSMLCAILMLQQNMSYHRSSACLWPDFHVKRWRGWQRSLLWEGMQALNRGSRPLSHIC